MIRESQGIVWHRLRWWSTGCHTFRDFVPNFYPTECDERDGTESTVVRAVAARPMFASEGRYSLTLSKAAETEFDARPVLEVIARTEGRAYG